MTEDAKDKTPDLDFYKASSTPTRWELFDLVSEQALITLAVMRKVIELRKSLELPDDQEMKEIWDRQIELFEKSRTLVSQEVGKNG